VGTLALSFSAKNLHESFEQLLISDTWLNNASDILLFLWLQES